MARRALKLASLAAAASGIYLYGNKFMDPNDFGVVRVGRAIATVSFVVAQYRKIPRGGSEDWSSQILVILYRPSLSVGN